MDTETRVNEERTEPRALAPDEFVPFDRVTWKREGYVDWPGGEVVNVVGSLVVVVWTRWDARARKHVTLRRHCRADQLEREA